MRAVVDLLVPPRCAACAAPAQGLCSGCAQRAAALRLQPDAVAVLGATIVAVGAYAYEGVIRNAVHGMKIAGRWAAARHLGASVRDLPGVPRHWPVTWVPSTRRRRAERGVDIPHLLAGPGAVAMLRRRADRPDQTSLTPQQRRDFPCDVFVASTAVPADVVLVDDVRTTGATARAAAQALLAGGAQRVVVATLAVGGDDARQTTVPLRHVRA